LIFAVLVEYVIRLCQFVCYCLLAMLEGFDSFYNDVNYDEVTKTHNMQLCALDEGRFN